MHVKMYKTVPLQRKQFIGYTLTTYWVYCELSVKAGEATGLMYSM